VQNLIYATILKNAPTIPTKPPVPNCAGLSNAVKSNLNNRLTGPDKPVCSGNSYLVFIEVVLPHGGVLGQKKEVSHGMPETGMRVYLPNCGLVRKVICLSWKTND
jgi:hypothetical protein